VNPLYRVGERSDMKIPRVVLSISKLLVGLFFRRIVRRYVIDSGHPIFLYYLAASAAYLGSFLIFVYDMISWAQSDWERIPQTSLIVSGFLFVVALQLTLGAFSLDFETNKHLFVHQKARGREAKT
jgi:FtsH-binding integral membrane protein